MKHFTIPRMTCANCISTISAAIQGVDGHAKVEAYLPARTIGIVTSLGVDLLIQTIRNAGYEAEPV